VQSPRRAGGRGVRWIDLWLDGRILLARVQAQGAAMGDDSFKGSVKIGNPEDKKQKVEVTYKAETDDKGKLTVKLKVEGEHATQIHTIAEAIEKEDADNKAARRKTQQDVQKAIQNQAEEIYNNRMKSSNKAFKTMSDYIRG
jgi:hypothetical protein